MRRCRRGIGASRRSVLVIVVEATAARLGRGPIAAVLLPQVVPVHQV